MNGSSYTRIEKRGRGLRDPAYLGAIELEGKRGGDNEGLFSLWGVNQGNCRHTIEASRLKLKEKEWLGRGCPPLSSNFISEKQKDQAEEGRNKLPRRLFSGSGQGK